MPAISLFGDVLYQVGRQLMSGPQEVQKHLAQFSPQTPKKEIFNEQG